MVRLLDLFCCEGGASTGYVQAGFEVYGVDIDARSAYPFAFHHGDALDVLRALLRGEAVAFTLDGITELLTLNDFAAVHASPPCQRFSTITPEAARADWPDLIAPTRDLLVQAGLPYVIENVEGARRELLDPARLCGSSFGLGVRRHRWFESTVWLVTPPCEHAAQPFPIGVYGHAGGKWRREDGSHHHNPARDVQHGREVMGMPWASWRGLVEAIPPAYTEWIGHQLMEALS